VKQRLCGEAACDRRIRVRTPLHIQIGVGGQPRARGRIVDEDRLGQPLIAQPLRRGDDALVRRLGKDDAQAASADLVATAVEDVDQLGATPGYASVYAVFTVV
jgi:hypothetical protein